jgi:hypothetical protein
MFSKKIKYLYETDFSTFTIILTHEHYFHYIQHLKQRVLIKSIVSE